MLRRCQLTPDVPFCTEHSLMSQHIWPGTIETFGRISPVKHDGYLMIGACLCNTMIEVDHFLIVTIHKICHDRSNSPFAELLQSGIELPVQGCTKRPQH